MLACGYSRGFREFLFFGTDSSFRHDQDPIHSYLQPQPPGTKVPAMIVECKGRIFLTNVQFVKQLEDFDKLIGKKDRFKDCKIYFAGDGLMQWRYNNLEEDGSPPNLLIHSVYRRP